MANTADHNAIITAAARRVLAPAGLFRKGQSRTWIDDNGWYLTVVEFQPSGWDRGTYLNVGVNFLWARREYLAFEFHTGSRGARVGDFVPFTGDEEDFRSRVTDLAETALEKAEEYRRLRDPQQAKEILSSAPFRRSDPVENYNRLMLCGLCRDGAARDWYDRLLAETENASIPWMLEMRRELTEDMAPLVDHPELLEGYIREKIAAQRAFWRGKSSMKKLRAD